MLETPYDHVIAAVEAAYFANASEGRKNDIVISGFLPSVMYQKLSREVKRAWLTLPEDTRWL